MGGGAGGGALWMIDRDGFGHSQEVVRSASGHMGLAAAGGGIKLKAEEEEKVRQRLQTSPLQTSDKVFQ